MTANKGRVAHGRQPRAQARTFFPPRTSRVGRLEPAEAVRAIKLARAALAAPAFKAILARDAAMMTLISYADLPSALISELKWRDVGDDSCSSLRLNINGLDLHLLLCPEVLRILFAWRKRLELKLERDVRPDEAVFPYMSPGKIPGRGALSPLAPTAVQTAIRRRLLAAGIDDDRARIRWLRGSLMGVDLSSLGCQNQSDHGSADVAAASLELPQRPP